MRDVVDDVAQVLVGQALGAGADRQVCQIPGDRQLQNTLTERQGEQPDRHAGQELADDLELGRGEVAPAACRGDAGQRAGPAAALERSEEHTSELQSHSDLVCRLLLEKTNPSYDRDQGSGSFRLQSTK